ncbi:hypothetical protein PNOK_0476500 [Pyrrhoderma noxium]|uniref:Uncharacterized protein n=1 Tax=Pyrrhoderma noxium TaxID=2282107 RepID=A0A286UJN7_9AGAM|nr:hypothetical protein PNOK_0476500 [Pyrrhoderma noxium]
MEFPEAVCEGTFKFDEERLPETHPYSNVLSDYSHISFIQAPNVSRYHKILGGLAFEWNVHIHVVRTTTSHGYSVFKLGDLNPGGNDSSCDGHTKIVHRK